MRRLVQSPGDLAVVDRDPAAACARDVTWVRDSLEKAEPPVRVVLALGLRPGEWLVRVA